MINPKIFCKSGPGPFHNSWSIPRRSPDSCQIPGHFRFFWTSGHPGNNAICTVAVTLVRQTFLEPLDLDLEVEANLLFLVEFGGEAIEALLVRTS